MARGQYRTTKRAALAAPRIYDPTPEAVKEAIRLLDDAHGTLGLSRHDLVERMPVENVLLDVRNLLTNPSQVTTPLGALASQTSIEIGPSVLGEQ